ncbi:MAG TPA: hypothetical protein VFI68_05840 [Anaerolineales bacterium]|nr:hypothetical protein [Anaerolineales bacterium]
MSDKYSLFILRRTEIRASLTTAATAAAALAKTLLATFIFTAFVVNYW